MRLSVYNTFLILSEAKKILFKYCFKFCAAVKLPVHEEMCSGWTCNADG